VPNAVSAILARQILEPQPLKVVTTLHGTDITLVGNDPNYLETTRYGIQQSDAVTTVSDFLRRDTQQQLGIAKRIEVVPNFIDPERYHRAFAGPGARRWAQGGERILVHVSNFRPVKRVLDVLEVFLRVRKQVPARLLLVGDGPDRAKVEQECRGCEACDEITFLGNLPAVEEVLVGADLFLLPSESESFGLSALEALAAKVPVIATKVGGLPEVVRDGENGLLFAVGDIAGMSSAAVDLLTDEQRREAMGDAGRAWALARFRQDLIVARYRELYERVLSGAP
ncbi:MAG TPA: N-acetyl-alpha-D-glucosaminyl L-malate synthase BshA, partial [Thermoanaerobaculia bacterium]|nr:N-acetyl-alpha-D-glucosaminyl L-malate synthase BshA [Thermoanaerobaculia bacterium]